MSAVDLATRRVRQLRAAISAGHLVCDDTGRLWHHCDDPTGPEDIAAIMRDTRIVDALMALGEVRVGHRGVLTLTPQPITEDAT